MPLIIYLFTFLFAFSAVASVPDEFPTQNQIKELEKQETVFFNYERIIDGDTFVASGKVIRLWGIDAPEKNEEFFELSKLALEHFLTTYTLTCKSIDIDRYQRSVMQCYADDIDIAMILVNYGFAKDYKKYSGGFYKEQQKHAKEQNLGIWK